jgi:2-C-methyl-D-erythritol 2,4-cyclodiphosphate synthase
MNFRVGQGLDVHRLVEGRPLILGGVTIPFTKGLLGHSDADVLTHAIIDALLGAAALGDIGTHFPDTDEQYRGISSLLLLERTKQMLDQNGWQINQIDATVVAQAPKLQPYISTIQLKLAACLHLLPEQISVKAKTTEGLAFTGRSEGIAAIAVATILKP